ncbi:unnamed protein product [Vitrella brassicaformis CCMP3155]|uniref:AAA+ ATPase domain-containing protein n=1 Tax=Vitrella brassicaformis (strain CCMP3155) TaxID=1169540 RepID=A0A0G4EUP3_VITBC|nr:unnamed protein product [Vitrella brassicaformis CCMP3155]|eukprot:CEM02169.1 unnamed protein product [Vitrella brassicaformis CCMP3155]
MEGLSSGSKRRALIEVGVSSEVGHILPKIQDRLLDAFRQLDGAMTALRYGTVPVERISDATARSCKVKHIVIEDAPGQPDPPQAGQKLYLFECHWELIVYVLSDADVGQEMVAVDGAEAGESNMPACQQWTMPHRDYLGLWEALMYEGILKQDLLSYANAALLFSDKGVDPQVVSFNRVLLLHGPPGTGKTSLCKSCKALAQKLSVRLQHRYSDSQLIEINSHSLFSRWFSESGKLVTKLFTRIRSLVSDPDSFVCVLIDEVESLTAARRSGGNEPSDAIRVVNALLTQIDSLKHYTNTLVLTTSNITGAIDLAFVDRADFKAYVPNPSLNCRYEIIRSAVHELVSKGVLVGSRSVPRFSHSFLESEAAPMDVHGTQQQQQYQQSFRSANEWRDFNSPETWGRWLAYIASLCEDFSGRALRKLPFQAFIIQGEVVGVADFLAALEQATRKEISARTSVDEGTTDMSRRTTASGREST